MLPSGVHNRIFFGWFVVAGAFFVILIGYGFLFSYGVFLTEFTSEFGWSRSTASLPYTVFIITYTIMAALTGRLADRYGARRVVFTGAIVMGAATILLSRITTLWHLYVVLVVVAGPGMSALFVPPLAAVIRWFDRRRGTAVGISSTAIGVSLIAFPPLITRIILLTDWRTGMALLGILTLVLAGGAALLLHPGPERMGLAPDGRRQPNPTPDPGHVPTAELSWTVRQAVGTGAFWLLIFGLIATYVFILLPTTHLVAHAQDRGLSPELAALTVSAIGVGNTLGRFGLTALSDRLGHLLSIRLSVVLQVLAFGGLALIPGTLPLYALAFLLGLGHGGVSGIFPVVVGDLYGRASAGALLGLVFALAVPFSALGPYIGGAIFDGLGAYFWAFVIAGLSNAIAAGFLVVLRPPTHPLVARGIPQARRTV